jgi:hypothetical protein
MNINKIKIGGCWISYYLFIVISIWVTTSFFITFNNFFIGINILNSFTKFFIGLYCGTLFSNCLRIGLFSMFVSLSWGSCNLFITLLKLNHIKFIHNEQNITKCLAIIFIFIFIIFFLLPVFLTFIFWVIVFIYSILVNFPLVLNIFGIN